MKIRFSQQLPVDESMYFETLFESAFQLSLEEKSQIIMNSIPIWMYSDNQLIGECYGIWPGALNEPIEDIKDRKDIDTIYCYSTALIKSFRGKGLSKILKAYWLGLVKANNFNNVVGHSTSPAMDKVIEFFNGSFIRTHNNWYGTRRKAKFYIIQI